MVESSTMVPLSHLADISLNCQEGVTDFRILKALLQIMIQQSGISDITVEFRGRESDRIQDILKNARHSESEYIQYTLQGSRPQPISSKQKVIDPQRRSKETISKLEETHERELKVIETRRDSKIEPEIEPPAFRSAPASLTGDIGESTVVLVDEPESKLPQFSVAVSKAAFEEIQEEIVLLKEKVEELSNLPGDLGLYRATETGSSPILDMFQILTLTKRMDAAEIVVGKLAGMVERLVRDSAISDQIQEVKESIEQMQADRESVKERLSQVEDVLVEIKSHVTLPSEESFHQSGQDIAHLSEESLPDMDGVLRSVLSGIDLAKLSTEEALALIQKEFLRVRNWIKNHKAEATDNNKEPSITAKDSIVEGVGDTSKQIEELDQVYRQQIGLIKEEINKIVTRMEFTFPGGDSRGITAESPKDLAGKLAFLEKSMVVLSQKAERLEADKEERDRNMEVILEQLDVLKIIKANREDLEDALEDKANASQIKGKVSLEQFDAACDDLSRGIEEALSRLQEQEAMWNQALEAVQKEIGNKLDKNDVDPLRDFVQSKLKAIQRKLKSISALKEERRVGEAAVSKKPLKDVTCLSCDNKVVMKTEVDESMTPRSHATTPSRSLGPYLAYELDLLRKQQNKCGAPRSRSYSENAQKASRFAKTKEFYGRNCGGSHTITTPQQRVTRVGNFLEQWGPEALPLNEFRAGVEAARSFQQAENAAAAASSKEEMPTTEDEVSALGVDQSAQKLLADYAIKNKSPSIERLSKLQLIGAAGRYSAEGEENLFLHRRSETPAEIKNLAKKNIQSNNENVTQQRNSLDVGAKVEAKNSKITGKLSTLKTSDSKQSEAKRIGFQENQQV